MNTLKKYDESISKCKSKKLAERRKIKAFTEAIKSIVEEPLLENIVNAHCALYESRFGRFAKGVHHYITNQAENPEKSNDWSIKDVYQDKYHQNIPGQPQRPTSGYPGTGWRIQQGSNDTHNPRTYAPIVRNYTYQRQSVPQEMPDDNQVIDNPPPQEPVTPPVQPAPTQETQTPAACVTPPCQASEETKVVKKPETPAQGSNAVKVPPKKKVISNPAVTYKWQDKDFSAVTTSSCMPSHPYVIHVASYDADDKAGAERLAYCLSNGIDVNYKKGGKPVSGVYLYQLNGQGKGSTRSKVWRVRVGFFASPQAASYYATNFITPLTKVGRFSQSRAGGKNEVTKGWWIDKCENDKFIEGTWELGTVVSSDCLDTSVSQTSASNETNAAEGGAVKSPAQPMGNADAKQQYDMSGYDASGSTSKLRDDINTWNGVIDSFSGLDGDFDDWYYANGAFTEEGRNLLTLDPDSSDNGVKKFALRMFYIYKNVIAFGAYCDKLPGSIKGVVMDDHWYSSDSIESSKKDMVDVLDDMMDELKSIYGKDHDVEERDDFFDEVNDFNDEIKSIYDALDNVAGMTNGDSAATKFAQDNNGYKAASKGKPSAKNLSGYLKWMAINQYRIQVIKTSSEPGAQEFSYFNPQDDFKEDKDIRLSDTEEDYIDTKRAAALVPQNKIDEVLTKFRSGEMNQDQANDELNSMYSVSLDNMKKSMNVLFRFSGITDDNPNANKIKQYFIDTHNKLDEPNAKKNWDKLVSNYKEKLTERIADFDKVNKDGMTPQLQNIRKKYSDLQVNADMLMKDINANDGDRLIKDCQEISVILETAGKDEETEKASPAPVVPATNKEKIQKPVKPIVPNPKKK